MWRERPDHLSDSGRDHDLSSTKGQDEDVRAVLYGGAAQQSEMTSTS